MEIAEDTKTRAVQLSKSRISSVDSRWLTANIEEVNRSYDQIQELIGSGAELFADNSDACYERQRQLIAHVEDILHKHQVLAEHLGSCNNHSSAFHHENGGDDIIGVSNESCFQTPDSKSISHYVNVEAPSTVLYQVSGGGSSNTSAKEGSEYSAISSHSDSETYEPSAYKSARSHLDVHRMLEHHFVGVEEVGRTNEGQLQRMTKYEIERSLYRKKLQLLEREPSSLENEIDSAQNEFQKPEIAFESNKKKVALLQNRVCMRDYEVVNSNKKTGSQEMELDLARLKLESSEEESTNLKSCPLNKNSDDSTDLKDMLELAHQQVAMLDVKLDGEKRQASEMQDKYITNILNRDDCIRKLETALQEVTDKSREDEFRFQSHISSLAKHLMLIEASSEEWENRCESLEEQLQQCEADMAKMRRLHEVQETRWTNDTDLVKTELSEKVGLVEILNQDLDTLKLMYDVLEAEKVSANGKVQALEAALCSKENYIWEMESYLHQLRLEKVEIISSSDKKDEDMKLKLKDLEKEVQSQKVLISDRAEEKREAIRQLCFAMEYYRNRYEDLLQVVRG